MQTKQTSVCCNCNVNRKLAFGLLLSLIAFLTAAPSTFAQNGTWTNLVGTNGVSIGDASGSWANVTNWNNGVIAGGINNTADFSTLNILSNSTVTLDSSPTIGNIIYGGTAANANWILNTGSGGTLTLNVSAGTPTITANSGSNTISAVIAGTNGFTKAGSGVLRLNGANVNLFSNINLSAGMLMAGSGNALGANTPNGNAVLWTNAVIVAPGATLGVIAGQAVSLKPVYVGGAGVGGTQGAIYADLSSLANNNTSTRLSIGLLANPSPAVIMTNNTTIRVDGTNIEASGSYMLIGHITTSNALTGHFASDTNILLTKTGTGKLSVDPASGYTGGNIHVAQGSFRFGNNSDLLGFQTVTVDAGTRFFCGNVSSLASPNSTIVLNDMMDIDGNTTVASIGVQVIGYLSGSSSGYITNGSLGAAQASTLTIAGTNGSATTFAGRIIQTANGSVGLILRNTNSTLILTGANTYRGVTTINAGTLLVDGSHTGGGAYTLNSGAAGPSILGGLGTISPASFANNGGTIMAGDPASPGGTLTINPSNSTITATSPGMVIISNATLSVSGSIGASAQPVGNLYMTNGTLQIPLNTLSPTVFVSGLTNDGSSIISYTMSTPLLGQYPIISYGSINGLAGFSGLTLVSPSGITATLSNNIANSTIDVVITAIPVLTWNGLPNGNWDIGTTTNWQGGYAWTQPGGTGLIALFDDTAHGTTSVNLTTVLTPKSVSVNNNSLNYTFSGSGYITGTGGLAKLGSGKLTVANSGNNFAGSVNLAQGTLQVGNGGTTGDLSTGPLSNQGTLALDRSDAVFTLANTVSGNGNITQAGAGNAIVPFNGNSSGTVTVTSGTLQIAPSSTSTFSGNVSGSGAFGVNGAGTLILNGGTVTYGGGTVISNGTLQFNTFFPPSGNILDYGTLALDVFGTLPNNISGNGGVSINSSGVTYTGSETYTGPTIVDGSAGSTLTVTASIYPSGSVLILGDPTNGTAGYGAVDFTAGNPVLPGLTVGGNNQSPGNSVNLGGSGQTLTINGNLTVGAAIPSGAYSLLAVTGTGATVVVSTNGGNIQLGLGAPGSGSNPDAVLADFSGINNLIVNLGTSTNGTNSVLNMGTLDGNPGPPGVIGGVVNQLQLAAVSNSITAGTINIGAGGRQLSPDLRLGPGTNILDVGTLNVGSVNLSRDSGQMEFYLGSGGVQIRGAAGGSTPANYNQGVNTSTTGAGLRTTVDFSSGYADLLFGPMAIGNLPGRAGQWTNVFTFSQGVLVASSLSLSQGGNTNADYTIMNINGGTATLGPVLLDGSVAANGQLNINNATVTVQSISHTNTGASTLSINNSTLNVNIQGYGNPATAPVSAGVLSLSAPVNLGVNGTGFTVGQFPLMSYTGNLGDTGDGNGFADLALASLPTNVSGYLSNNVANSSVDLVITSAPPSINPNPTNIVVGISGNQLTLRWDSSHIGWLLQSNSVGLISTGSWATVTGSGSTNQFIFTINPAATNVFFRMLHP
jgi:fibronectin-binding autotransporter adhesin